VPQISRESAKVLLVTPDLEVLLLSAVDPLQPDRPSHWFPVGGGVEDGESLESAAIREVQEETGLVVADVGEPLMTRHASFDFEGEHFEQDETYYLASVVRFELNTEGWTEVERRSVSGYRWWTLEELRTTDETVFPENLANVVERAMLSR
jgi:8-oxo-dGTP pyrophosphatase MutT (NUDIX family)